MQDSREEEDHNVTLSTTKRHKQLRLKADNMYRRNAERSTQRQKERKFVHSRSVTLQVLKSQG